ncbi:MULTISPECIES: hypothetical protein [unclassified Streptomyces]|uniref:hypothetical protein n=1 Tax=unclassified Streptomyces TaxID=2593676 RepID=UPI0016620E69|nr:MULTISPECIES: hypothetical protein [unclassified Streptomyces]MBD0841444.1 hypothetical protein [Streptomyces sp. TRM68416]
MVELTRVTGHEQHVGPRTEFAPLSVMALAGDGPAGGRMVSFFVDDPEGTGTDFRGGSPVRVTTASDGTGTTDVPLVAGDLPGAVEVKAIAEEGAHASFALHVIDQRDGTDSVSLS